MWDQSACTNAQSDSMSVKLLTEHRLEFVSLKGGCTGSSESKSHVAAQFMIYLLRADAYLHISKKRKFQTSTTNLDLIHTVRRFMLEFIEIVFGFFSCKPMRHSYTPYTRDAARQLCFVC